ncbi:DUF998 domain-containing protein [Microbacterium fluvii]|uniref:DUF998 domain-containing protein n=1 Tax=Microbacterium fluvii TaxID=415215 RepID=A0ABW2HCY0_9MICO|nr:DUF998 domain-containing protein [Microbacterium fluvii]MCU4672835.1 DUF998 domain-containing protein [Microbacterium fluvii]
MNGGSGGRGLRPLSAMIADRTEKSLESLALGVGAVAFVLSAVAALLVFGLEPTPISGHGSVGQFSAIASAVVGIGAFAFGRFVLNRRGEGPRPLGPLDYLDVAALAFAHGVIALLAWLLVADIMAEAFVDAEVFALPTLALAGATAAVTAYLSFFSATHMDLQLLAVVLAVFLVLGITASMLTASDPLWWHEHLSALGMSDDISALAFNLTLIVAGVIVTTLARYTTRALPNVVGTGGRSIRTCLVMIGVFLGLVGVFPVDRFFWIHTAVASGMVVAYGVLVVRLSHWMPGLSRPFLLMGLLFLAAIVVLGVLYAVGYYTLTAVELVAGVLVFSWIIVFIRGAAVLGQDARAEGPHPR